MVVILEIQPKAYRCDTCRPEFMFLKLSSLWFKPSKSSVMYYSRPESEQTSSSLICIFCKFFPSVLWIPSAARANGSCCFFQVPAVYMKEYGKCEGICKALPLKNKMGMSWRSFLKAWQYRGSQRDQFFFFSFWSWRLNLESKPCI